MEWPAIPLPRRFQVARRSRLVGRRHELAELEGIWSRVEDGDGQVVLLGGEPGAGKTRLAVEVAGALHDHGVPVLIAAAGKDAGVPYQPVVELLDHLFEHAPCCATERGEVCPLLAGAPYDLGRISGRAARHHAPEVTRTSGDARRDLFDALAMLLRRLAEEQPLAVVLDDLQWATQPTVALLKHVAGSTVDSRLLLMATFRTTAPDRSPELSEHLADLHRLDGVHRLDLGGLDTAAIADFVSEHAGISASAARQPASILRDRTGGNPFYLREMWTDVQRHGGVESLRDGRSVPASIADTIAVRLAGVGPEVLEIVQLAAVLGDSFDIATLVTASEVGGTRSVEAVDSAVSAGLLEAVDDPPARYGFVHSLTRQVVLDRLPAARLQPLHAQAAHALDRGPETSPDLYPRLAHHYLCAHPLGYREQAYRYACLAARQAAHSLAFEDAAGWFERAAALPETAADEVADSLFGAAQNYLRASEFARARDIYDRLTEMPDPLTRLRAAMGFEDTNWRPGPIDARAAELLATAIADCGLPEDDVRHVRATASLARALAFAGQHDRAESLGSRAMAMARRTDDRATVMHTLRTGLWHDLLPGGVDRQLDRVRELTALAREAVDHESLAEAAHFGALASYLAGRPVELEGYIRQERAAAASGRQPFMDYTATCMMQSRAFRRGEFDEAERLADAALQIGEFDAESTDGPHSVQLFMIRRETGRLDAVRPLVTGQEQFAGRWLPGLLALYTELGLTDGMRRTLRTLLARDVESYVADARFPIELAFLADAAADLADAEAMDTLLPFLTAYAGGNIATGQFVAVFGSADRYLARFAEAGGDHGAADRLFASALAMDRRMGSAVHIAETLARHAVVLHRRGDDPARAARLAAEARSHAEPIRQLRVLRWLDAISVGATPDGLTGRELDVLRLLAAGLSNREIGAQLFISANTAANHVRSILLKTGATNRTQAARYATDHDLV
ncbi:helix-turn-helix transcriptional regulator [Flexivirga oryzae]|uniref:DNA-binding CsgD family transcriptional regulator/tetratricopeptide (TPR) repeat protein n=1 Tax=Flexivirga oryzae TaxID=1794944 RepID=A0A839N4L5_9MICO|nr:LuxR family transcriptional regulator [Flexivirga oryzae]MBB2892700.1 DNA-binding CsgD family transcriptional regulator/tetratricopeptide (TPR) repeat protein [Flexivirga oryzae]